MLEEKNKKSPKKRSIKIKSAPKINQSKRSNVTKIDSVTTKKNNQDVSEKQLLVTKKIENKEND